MYFIVGLWYNKPTIKLFFERGYEVIQKQLLTERITYIYNCGAARVSLDSVLALVA